ncbi:MAG: polyprenyl synthetase family protein [candidate division WOR-3 bacterium]
MRYAVMGPGKRIRPIAALESFYACGGRQREWILPFCCGLELIHNFSLIHDDLPSMDNDDYRRGRLTLHRKFDEATAILAGDALLAQAFELFAGSTAPEQRKIRAMKLIASAIGPKGMAAGQLLDIQSQSPRRYLATAQLKTAALFVASIVTGAIIAGADVKLQSSLARLGINLGILFQITDDLLDYGGEDFRKIGGYHRTIAGLRMKAANLARITENGFRRLGPKFDFFVHLTRLICNRQD